MGPLRAPPVFGNAFDAISMAACTCCSTNSLFTACFGWEDSLLLSIRMPSNPISPGALRYRELPLSKRISRFSPRRVIFAASAHAECAAEPGTVAGIKSKRKEKRTRKERDITYDEIIFKLGMTPRARTPGPPGRSCRCSGMSLIFYVICKPQTDSKTLYKW